MDVRNCKECGRLFNYISGPRLCPACRDKLEEKFSQVKKYIEDNRTAQLQQISEDNDVSIQQIKQWVREERLAFTEDSLVGIECERCGCTIKTGRFCENCKKTMVNTLGNAYKKEAPMMQRHQRYDRDERAKMRFLDN